MKTDDTKEPGSFRPQEAAPFALQPQALNEKRKAKRDDGAGSEVSSYYDSEEDKQENEQQDKEYDP